MLNLVKKSRPSKYTMFRVLWTERYTYKLVERNRYVRKGLTIRCNIWWPYDGTVTPEERMFMVLCIDMIAQIWYDRTMIDGLSDWLTDVRTDWLTWLTDLIDWLIDWVVYFFILVEWWPLVQRESSFWHRCGINVLQAWRHLELYD